MFAVLDALDAHDGAAFQSWRRSVAASVGAVLLDDLTASPENGRRDA